MKYLTVLFLSVFLFSCGESTPEEKEQNALHESLYAVHDEIMPEMSTINRLSRQLKKVRKNNELDSIQIAQIDSALRNLEKGDEAMMDWMAQYKKPSKLRGEKTHDEIMVYLNSENEKINHVKDLMESGIKEGQDILKKFE